MAINTRVLRWYSRNKRALPWRENSTPYYIWISEIIFQQTRISQGLDYYIRFIRRFPDIASLARAPGSAVLKMWQGLGYYSRARNLHETAKYLYKNHGGQLPSEYPELIKLKGIGSYTAAAIASIAFNKPVALVDGNVYRVLSRYYGMHTPVDSPAARKVFQEKADSILNKKNPGDHNQAMMELGALVCLPQNPGCSRCPLKNGCYAYRHGKTSVLPVKNKAPRPKKRSFIYLDISDEKGNTYLKQRTGKDIWQGLYDYPLLEEQFRRGTIRRAIGLFLKTLKFEVTGISGEYSHKLSHQALSAYFVTISMHSSDIPAGAGWKAVKPSCVKRLALPKLMENYLKKRDKK